MTNRLAVSPADAPKQRTYAAPACRVDLPDGRSCESSLFHPDGFSLWSVDAHLPPGATMNWDRDHGDEALFIRSGSIEVAGRTCPAGGAVIIESSVPAVVSVREGTALIHVGPTERVAPRDGLLGPPRSTGHTVHVVGPADAVRIGNEVAQWSYADSTCETCRIALFIIDGAAELDSGSHHHSEDEIIHVLSGHLQVGPQRVGPGTSVAIPRGRTYGFRTDGPFSFLNYRRDVSTLTMSRDGVPWRETNAELLRFMREQMPDNVGDPARPESAS